MSSKKKDALHLENIVHLIDEGQKFATPDFWGQGFKYSTNAQYGLINAWAASAQNSLFNLLGGDNAPYMEQMHAQMEQLKKYNEDAYNIASAILCLLTKVRHDYDKGLMVDLESLYSAEVFDDFLQHADAYVQSKQVQESAVIASVVFEDTVKKVCKKSGIETDGKTLEPLINALKSANLISKTKASRCKSAATVRNAATHANWEQIDMGAVKETISLTRELINEFLEG